jgi:hypothetical protein
LGRKYLVFGLVVDSPIPLPEAYPADPGAPAEVAVYFGPAGEGFPKDEFFEDAREKRSWWQGMLGESRTLFNSPPGLFEIRNGKEIIVEVYPGADQEILKIYLLGSAMGAVQVQRGRIPLHGGAVIMPKGAMIITGGQGIGKSTMTSAFVHNGFPYLTDDVSSLSVENGKAAIIPAYPQRKLVRDACAPLGYEPGDLILVDSGRDKFAVRDRENWCREPSALWAILELYPAGEGEGLSVSLVKGREKLSCVTRNLYRVWMHVYDSTVKPEVFKKMLTIAAQAEIYYARVPRDIGNITGIAQGIASDLV